MLDLEKIVKNSPRYLHSSGVCKMALKLNEYYGLNVDPEKIKIASMLHDITKNFTDDENLEILHKMYEHVPKELLDAKAIWHAFTASYYVKEKYNILDEEILDAIKYHTTGKVNMTDLEKLIFLSDYIEENRIGENFEKARKLAFESLFKAIICMYEDEFAFIKSKGGSIHHLSIDAYNYYKEGKYMIDELIKILDKAVVKDIKVYDTSSFTPYFDYVIIASASSARQGAACVNYLKKEAQTVGLDVKSFSSSSDTSWFLVDLNSVVVHVFVGEERARYNLDGIYSHLLTK